MARLSEMEKTMRRSRRLVAESLRRRRNEALRDEVKKRTEADPRGFFICELNEMEWIERFLLDRVLEHVPPAAFAAAIKKAEELARQLFDQRQPKQRAGTGPEMATGEQARPVSSEGEKAAS